MGMEYIVQEGLCFGEVMGDEHLVIGLGVVLALRLIRHFAAVSGVIQKGSLTVFGVPNKMPQCIEEVPGSGLFIDQSDRIHGKARDILHSLSHEMHIVHASVQIIDCPVPGTIPINAYKKCLREHLSQSISNDKKLFLEN